MKNSTTQPWIEAGYEIFSKEGPNGLKVEQIARKVGKSKSSFYHLFADMEIFTEQLLDYHRERALIIAEKAGQCKTLVPDMIHVAIENKPDFLFNRQLRVHRDKPLYQQCSEEAAAVFVQAFEEIWAASLGLSQKPAMARNIMNITIDNFLLRLSEETLTYEWMLAYLNDLKFVITNLSGTDKSSES